MGDRIKACLICKTPGLRSGMRMAYAKGTKTIRGYVCPKCVKEREQSSNA